MPWRRKWQPTPVPLPGKSHGQRSLAGYSPCGCKESDTTEWRHFHFHFFLSLPKCIPHSFLSGKDLISRKTRISNRETQKVPTSKSANSLASGPIYLIPSCSYEWLSLHLLKAAPPSDTWIHPLQSRRRLCSYSFALPSQNCPLLYHFDYSNEHHVINSWYDLPHPLLATSLYPISAKIPQRIFWIHWPHNSLLNTFWSCFCLYPLHENACQSNPMLISWSSFLFHQHNLFQLIILF